MHLFGFATEAERDLFLMLIGVQSVGPKVALGRALRRRRRASSLTRDRQRATPPASRPCPGIGKRTAERIIVELREKVAGAVADEIVGHARLRRSAHARARGRCSGSGFSAAGGRRAAGRRRRRHARGADRRGAEGARGDAASAHPASSASRRPSVDGAAEEELDRSLRPRGWTTSSARSAVKEQLGVFIEAARARGEALDHVLLAGPPGLGKTSLAQIVANELGGRRSSSTAGPALERKGDVARYLSVARAALGLLRRRDPPPPARARGDLLPGDGGPAAADHGRPGRGRAGRQPRPAAVHADRRDHPRRAAHHAAARPLRRDATGSSSTTPDELGQIVRRSAGILDVEIDDGGRRGDRRPLARHAARGQPPAQARARLRRGPRRRPRSTPPWRPRRSTCSRSTRLGLDRLDREILQRDLREVRRRPGRPVDARRSRSARSRTRSRTSTSRTCSSRA